MTDKTQLVTFTPEERAILDGTSTVKLEETDGGATGGAADGAGSEDGAENTAPEAKPDGADAGKADGDNAGDDESDEEPTEVADGTNPDAPARRKVIAFSAYEKQRQAKKALAEEVTKLREQVAYVTGLAQNAPKPQQQAPQTAQQELTDTPPDKAKDPEGYLKWLETAAQETIRIRRQSVQHAEQSSQFQQINDAVYAHEQAFIKGDPDSGTEAHPDFLEAVSFLRDKQTKELKTAGYEQHEINQIMAARAQDISLRALKANDSPAKRVYSLAKLNGYKAAAAAKVETEAEKITRQAKSQEKAGKTISALPGGEAKGGLTAESLANMDPAAFKKLWDSGEAKALMGWKD